MQFKPEQLKAAIETAMPGAQVEVRDTTGGGDHFQITVVSPAFVGKSLVEQHKMVYRTLADMDVHAIGLKTKTPE